MHLINPEFPTQASSETEPGRVESSGARGSIHDNSEAAHERTSTRLVHEFGHAWAGGAATDTDLAALHIDLQGFSVPMVTKALGPMAHDALMREQPVPALRATATRNDAISLFVRLFTLGRPVLSADLAQHLPTIGIDGLVRLGLIAVEPVAPDEPDAPDAPELVRALVDLRPYSANLNAPDSEIGAHPVTEETEPIPTHNSGAVDWWIVSDLSEVALGGPLHPHHVLGVGGATTTLVQATIRREVETALDLGTGCGLQAMHLAMHAKHVVATDISWRALDMARFNARLNRVEVEFRFGSMLEPVKTEKFDLVVSNPPFVITPRNPDVPEYTYRDGGQSGDSIVEELVRSVGNVLKPGGVAQFLGNWEARGDVDWQTRLHEWLADSELDAWVIQREFQDPAEYAETWIRDGGTYPHHRDYDSLMDAWLNDLESREVSGVGFGIFTMQRPEHEHENPAPWVRIEERPEALRQALGTHLDLCLATKQRLQLLSDADLLSAHLVRADDVTEERHYTPGAADPTVIVLNQGQGFGRKIHADTVLAGFVGACDGELSAGQIIGGIAALFDLDSSELSENLLPTLRELVVDQFLSINPAETGSRRDLEQ